MFTAFFAVVGYALLKFGFEPAPMLLGFVLGKLMEEKLRQAMILSRGSFMTFVERPLSAALLVVSAIMLLIAILPVRGPSLARSGPSQARPPNARCSRVAGVRSRTADANGPAARRSA